MALTPSTMLELGVEAPDFNLPDPDGKLYARDNVRDAPALLVMFICNHCPYVKHIRAGLAQFASDYSERGLAIVAISSNDVSTHPADSPSKSRKGVLSTACRSTLPSPQAWSVCLEVKA